MFAGFCLLTLGTLLSMFEVTEGGRLGIFLALVGLVYFGVAIVVTLIHDRHMAQRTRAGQEQE
jgi:hypothetical protein